MSYAKIACGHCGSENVRRHTVEPQTILDFGKTYWVCSTCSFDTRYPASALNPDMGNPTSAHKLNADQTVAVATDVFWNEDMTTCPQGTKCQLLGAGGVAVYGTYHGDPFWIGWCPLPKRRK